MKKKYRIPIGQLFNFLGLLDVNPDCPVRIDRDIKIKTPPGNFVKINYLIKKRGKIFEFKMDNGVDMLCDEHHLVKSNGKFHHIINLNSVDTVNGNIGIASKTFIETGDVFDMSIDSPHEYITSTDIICHNTTLGKILVNNIECDHLYINASSENNIDTVRTKLTTFASTKGFSPLKIIFLDECDYITIQSQAALRNLMEMFSTSTRFILTCNYIERMIPAIQSRCQKFNIMPPSKKEVAVHLCKILEKEKVKYEISDLKILVDASYPDIRAIIQAAQQNTLDGILKVNTRDIIESDTKLKLIDILSGNKPAKDIFTSIRQLIADNSITQYEEYYEFLYEKIDSYAKGHIGQVILILAEFEQSSTMVINKNISFMACICKILEITKG